MLDHITNTKNHIEGISSLDHITISESLYKQFEVYLLACRVNGLSPATLSSYQLQVGQFVKFCYQAGLNDAHDITTHHIRAFLLSLQERISPTSLHDFYGTIKRFFNWMIEEGIIVQSPFVNIKPPKIPKLIPKPFSHKDIENLLALCSGNRFLDIRNRAIILTFLDTGLRLSELANIQLKDIDLDRETIKVMGKGAKERRVRIGRTTQKAILRYLLSRQDKYPCLWVTEEKQPMGAIGIQIMIRRLYHRAGINGTKCGPHTFRHTAAINYLRNGGSEFTLQIMLGHSTLTMTRKYVASLGEDDLIRVHKIASPVDNLGLKG